MALKLKKLSEQVIVITGASSGIGLATAQTAAERGAKVVLTSRDETDLQSATDYIKGRGGDAIYVVADVADFVAMQRVAERAVSEWGGIDTWVNNAGVSIYGMIEDVPLEDAQRLFQTNYFGVVNGSLAALPHLKRRAVAGGKGSGTALINIGSVLSDTPVPVQGHYSASKHAVKGFTDTLRMELEYNQDPVSVSLIQPAAIDTPYPLHAANYLGVEPTHTPPVYAPQLVAEAILTCAEKPRRDMKVGDAAGVFILTEMFAPRLGDKFKEAVQVKGSMTDKPESDSANTLYQPRPGDGRIHGRYEGHVLSSSPVTSAALRPAVTAALLVGAVGLTLACISGGVAAAAPTGGKSNGKNGGSPGLMPDDKQDEAPARPEAFADSGVGSTSERQW